jgi:ABC-type transport system substrate-binding protein
MLLSHLHPRRLAATAVLAGALATLLCVPPIFSSILPIAQPTKAPQRPADLLKVERDSPIQVAELFRELARPCDRVQCGTDETIAIEPLGADVLLDPEFTGTIMGQELVDGDKPGRQLELTRAKCQYLPYEQQALAAVAKFEKASEQLPSLQRLTAMETALAVALRFSLGTRERPLKGSSRWDILQAELDRKLLGVRLRLLREHAAVANDEAQWRDAVRFGDAMLASYSGDKAVVTEVARLRLRFAGFLLLHGAANRYAAVRQQLEWIDDHLLAPPRPDPLELLGDVLSQAGQSLMLLYRPDAEAFREVLVNKAAALAANKDDKTAEKSLQQALEIWPRLPGLRDELLKRQGKYAILNIGVRGLPKYLSPARAATDAEKQVLELLFEALVQTQPTEDGSLVFAPRLAASLPRMADSERLFQLKKTARWSSGGRVTSADVQRTMELLTSPTLLGHSSELTDRVEPLRGGDEPFRVHAKLRQGLLEPLSPFTFKVLPRNNGGVSLAAADDDAFALTPIGSGPYMLAGTGIENGRGFVRFVVNPHYLDRDHPAGPKIREVRFFVSTDPAADLASKTLPMHLLLDVPTQELGKVKATGAGEVRTMQTRRVNFLAVNHRDPVLADEAVRRALAHAIDRKQLLADCFGGGRPLFRTAGIAAWGSTLPIMAAALAPKGAAMHQALNGPYPSGSWATCTDGRVPKTLFDRVQAETFLSKSKTKALDLELKYPDDDTRIEQACQAIARQLAEVGDHAGKPIKVRLVALSPQQLKRDVLAHRYQLAYWHHDFPDDSYDLWPLFDPRNEALATGSNYLGFKDDGTLAELLQKAGSYRDFHEVKRLTHDIHVVLFERMPLIPLWQLDYHLGVHPQLRLPTLDSLKVFGNVMDWDLKKG